MTRWDRLSHWLARPATSHDILFIALVTIVLAVVAWRVLA